MVAPSVLAPMTSGQPDLDRIKRNVAKMAEMGAPETDIDGYIQSEGVTVDAVKAHKGGGNWLRRTVQGAVDMVRGTQDPALAGTPDLIGAYQTLDPQTRDRVLQGSTPAKTAAISDEAYSDVLRTQLGDAFVRQETDANGYPVLVYRDKDGQEAKAYANRPGLDWQDVDRGISAAFPYLIGGGTVGTVTRNLGPVKRTALQTLTGAGVSVGQDVTASGMGSEQGIDPTRAVIAGVLAGVSEAAAPLIHMGKGALGFGTKYIDDAGKLTPDGVKAARRAGVDPKDLDAETTAAFADALRVGRDPAEALSQVRSNTFGIPTTKGQRTKDPELLTIEKDIRYGSLGPDAKAEIGKLDKEQAQAITNQVRGHIAPGRNGADEFRGVGAEIAPTRLPHDQNLQTMGQSVRGGLTEARDVIKGQERAAWEAVPDITPQPQAFESLPSFLENNLGRMRLDDKLTPTAMRMDAELAAYKAGNAVFEGGPQMVNQSPIRTLDEMRRRLLDSYKSAPPGTADAKAAKAYYDGFNDWVWDAAEKGLINGGPDAAAKMHAAREITREVKSLFQPRNAQGKATPGSRILAQVMDDADTPERIIATLLGEGGPQTTPKAGVVEALGRIRTILDKGGGSAGNMVAKETWNDIRLAYWLRLTTDKSGATLSPTMIKKNIEQAFTSQKSILDILYKPAEKRQFNKFAKAVGEAAYKDPNPSGTASALRAMANGPRDSLLKTGLQTQSKRELFSKHNVIMSRIYSMLAQKVPNLGGTRDAIGLRAAQRAVDQRLTPRRPQPIGQFGAAGGAQYGSE